MVGRLRCTAVAKLAYEVSSKSKKMVQKIKCLHLNIYIHIPQFLHQDPNTELHSTPDTLTVQNNDNTLVTESSQIIYSTDNMRITYR